MLIQWYPGHMAKAKRMLEENLKLIDVSIELVDARAPLSTSNPDLSALCRDKQRIIVLNKSDLADPAATKKWLEYFKARNFSALDFVSTNNAKRKQAQDMITHAASREIERLKARGVAKTVRAMVVGIPNVGKSTFINRVAGVSRAVVGDKPGVTKGKQWVKITPYLELMDTPGLLWPRLDHELMAQNIAFIGSIRDDTMDIEALSVLLLEKRPVLAPDHLAARYKHITPDMRGETRLESVCTSRGFILAGGAPDTARAARVVLDEFRAGKIANVSLEQPEDYSDGKV
jgi:ribosome biogenesis GTPase A